MKILFLILTLLLFTLSAPVYAQTSEAGETIEHAQSAKLNEAHVSVNGLVCDFCARALEKTFGKQDEVSSIDVNLDTKIVTVMFNENQSLSDERLTEIITDSGYNVEGIHRVE
jgi:copper chaperone CopZ